MQGTSLEDCSVMSSKLRELKELERLSLIPSLFLSYNRRSTVFCMCVV